MVPHYDESRCYQDEVELAVVKIAEICGIALLEMTVADAERRRSRVASFDPEQQVTSFGSAS